jgi:hypothetical protein
MHDSNAYNLLIRHCQFLERELTKERQDNVSLKYVSHIRHNFEIPADVHRNSLQTLLNSNNKLSSVVTECTKRPRSDDLDSKSTIPLDRIAQPLTSVLPLFLHSEYPFVRFWTRDEWKTHHATARDSSEVGNAQDDRAIGVNKSMAYIEQDDGTPVSSDTASQIRHFARSIWRGYRE